MGSLRAGSIDGGFDRKVLDYASSVAAVNGWLIRIRAAALRGVLWPAAGIVFALLTHLLWGAAEKNFIYFRF